jgi:hypothetical protein
MAGTILISDKKGLAVSTIDFDYFAKQIEVPLTNLDQIIFDEVYSPYNEGGMTFITAEELSDISFGIFARAVKKAYLNSTTEERFIKYQELWDKLLKIVQDDERCDLNLKSSD